MGHEGQVVAEGQIWVLSGGGSAPAGAVGPERPVQEADDDSFASTPQRARCGRPAAPAQVGFSSGAREEQFRTQFGASGQADMATMMAMLHSQGEALRSGMGEVANLGRRVDSGKAAAYSDSRCSG